MKKIINSKTIPAIVIISGILGLILRLWIIGEGENAFGLYPSHPVGWALLWVLTAGLAAMIVFACWPLKTAGSYEENYPKSLAGMLGSLVAGIGIIFTGIWQLRGNEFILLTVLDKVVGVGGVAAGGALILLGVQRFLGKKPNFLLHGFLCLFFAVRVFHHCRLWSNEPQIGTVVLPFLASLSLMLAGYQRTCFDVDLGNRRHCLLWSLMGAYLCILAIFSFEEILFYGPCALWLLTDLCSLRPIRRKKSQETAEQEAAKEENVVACAEETAEIEDDAACAPETMTMEELENWLEHPEKN
jgi:hypothetical protein